MTEDSPAVVELRKEIGKLESDAIALRNALQVLLRRDGNSDQNAIAESDIPQVESSADRKSPPSEWEPRTLELVGDGIQLIELHRALEKEFDLTYKDLINWTKRAERNDIIEKVSRGRWRTTSQKQEQRNVFPVTPDSAEEISANDKKKADPRE